MAPKKRLSLLGNEFFYKQKQYSIDAVFKLNPIF